MLLRMLLVLVAVAGLSVSGCAKKDEPVKPSGDEVQDVVDGAEEVVEDAAN